MYFHKDERIGIFIDGANLYTTSKKLNFKINYAYITKLFAQKGRLVKANYYTAIDENDPYSTTNPLVDWLQYNGYSIITKPLKKFSNAKGEQRVKGNMDIEIAVDMINMAQYLDHIVLFSGDGDFCAVVEDVQKKGVRVSVVSTTLTKPPMIADELRRKTDNFIEISSIIDKISIKNTEEKEEFITATEPIID